RLPRSSTLVPCTTLFRSVIFVIAAVSDVFDGYLARSRNMVSDLGKLLDPIADKLLLFATLVPIYWISRQRQHLYDIPVWGSIPRSEEHTSELQSRENLVC